MMNRPGVLGMDRLVTNGDSVDAKKGFEFDHPTVGEPDNVDVEDDNVDAKKFIESVAKLFGSDLFEPSCTPKYGGRRQRHTPTPHAIAKSPKSKRNIEPKVPLTPWEPSMHLPPVENIKTISRRSPKIEQKFEDHLHTSLGPSVQRRGQEGIKPIPRGIFAYGEDREVEYKLPVRLPTTRDSDEYNMSHKHRGKCIIFNNKKFEPYLRLENRSGTDVDARNLYWRFTKLNFQVEIHDDSTCGEMRKVLEKASKDDHTDEDCIVCCVLSHGHKGIVYGTDGKLNVRDVFSHFNADVCPSLAGKPKLFFIQACQGELKDEGVEVIPRFATDSGSPIKIPTHADFLMSFATVPEYVSWRNGSTGSTFIQGLCSVLQEKGQEVDLMSMMSDVNRYVAYSFESNVPGDPEMHQMKQMPCLKSTLTRKVFFRPKVRVPNLFRSGTPV